MGVEKVASIAFERRQTGSHKMVKAPAFRASWMFFPGFTQSMSHIGSADPEYTHKDYDACRSAQGNVLIWVPSHDFHEMPVDRFMSNRCEDLCADLEICMERLPKFYADDAVCVAK